MARHALQLHGGVQQVARPWLVLVKLHQVGAVKFVALGEHILDGDGLAGDGGDELGDFVHQGQFHAFGAAHVAHGRARFHAAKGGYLCDLVLAIFLQRVADHLFALVIGIVQVEVGHGDAAGVEETLEDQVVLERVNAGDAHAVGDQRPRAGAAHVPPDVAAAGKVAQVRHDQVVDIEAHFVDDAQFPFFALLHYIVVRVLAVEFQQPLFGEVAQIGFIGESVGDGQVGQVVAGIFQVHAAHLGDAHGVIKCAGGQVKQRAEGSFHLGAALEEVGAVAHAHAFLGRHGDAGLHADQHVVGAAILLAHIMHVVGGD